VERRIVSSPVISERIATPTSRPGIIIGAANATRTAPRNGRRERTSGNAAQVPTNVDTAVTATATLIEVSKASWIERFSITSPYHWVVQPVMGNVPSGFALKLNTTSSRIGANRKK